MIQSLLFSLALISGEAPELPVMTAGDLAAQAAPPPLALPPAPPPPEVIEPGERGILDAAGAARRMEIEPMPNPFRRRFHPPVPVKDVPLLISAILTNGRPAEACAVLNGAVYSPGESWEGMPIAAISRETIDLRRDKIVLRVPVRDQPILVRLPAN